MSGAGGDLPLAARAVHGQHLRALSPGAEAEVGRRLSLAVRGLPFLALGALRQPLPGSAGGVLKSTEERQARRVGEGRAISKEAVKSTFK